MALILAHRVVVRRPRRGRGARRHRGARVGGAKPGRGARALRRRGARAREPRSRAAPARDGERRARARRRRLEDVDAIARHLRSRADRLAAGRAVASRRRSPTARGKPLVSRAPHRGPPGVGAARRAAAGAAVPGLRGLRRSHGAVRACADAGERRSCSGRRATTPRARRSTRWPSAWACGTRAGARSTLHARRGRRGRVRLSAPDAARARTRDELLGPQDRRRARDRARSSSARRQARARPIVCDLCAAFQEAAIDVLVAKARRALRRHRPRARLALVGGLAANSRLRERMAELAAELGVETHFPPIAAVHRQRGDDRRRRGRHAARAAASRTLDLEAFSRVPRRPPGRAIASRAPPARRARPRAVEGARPELPAPSRARPSAS